MQLAVMSCTVWCVYASNRKQENKSQALEHHWEHVVSVAAIKAIRFMLEYCTKHAAMCFSAAQPSERVWLLKNRRD